MSVDSVYTDPWQLPSQLVGRLLSHAPAAEEIALLLESAQQWNGKLPRGLCQVHHETSEKEPKKMTVVGEGLEGGWWCPVSSTLDSPGGPLLCTLQGHEDGVILGFDYSVGAHEMHHRNPSCNMAQYWMGLDRLMGTWRAYTPVKGSSDIANTAPASASKRSVEKED